MSPQDRLAINQKVSIAEVVVSAGLDYINDGNRYRIPCPFHDGDNDPSLFIYTSNMPHSWWCFGCGRGYDAVEFLRLFYRKSLEAIAIQYLGKSGKPSITDAVDSILGFQYEDRKKRLELVFSTSMLSLSLRVRSILRRVQENHEEIARIQSILMQVDDFESCEAWLALSEFEVKDYFSQIMLRIKNVSTKQ